LDEDIERASKIGKRGNEEPKTKKKEEWVKVNFY
jgi:hypothetical protein